MDLTCYHCGGTEFVLVVSDRVEVKTANYPQVLSNEPTTEIRCVRHEDHVAEEDV